jgi:hypothetical protein
VPSKNGPMNRRSRQRLAAVAAAALLIAGGAIAAVNALGQGTGNGGSGRALAHRIHRRDLGAAATYLGLSGIQLEADLRSGQSLAQIANATPGKSAGGLIDALVAARKQKLAAAAAKLTEQVTAEVNRVGGPGAAGLAHPNFATNLFAARRRLGFAAASYLGISPSQLQADLRSGQSLAQIANATPGKSAGGLIDALVAARRGKISAAVSSGRLPKNRAEALSAKAPRRITLLVNRTPRKRSPSSTG